jgi:hypothetical protein
MRRLVLFVLCLFACGGCQGFGSRARSKQPAESAAVPERQESVDSMRAAHAEAARELNNW